MPYLNLIAEMAKRRVSIENLADLLEIHRNSASNKVNGKTQFTVDEAFSVQRTFFPNLTVQYLFEMPSSEDEQNHSVAQREVV